MAEAEHAIGEKKGPRQSGAQSGDGAIDIAARGPAWVAAAFANQVAYCERAGAPITACVVAAVARALDGTADNRLAAAIRGWTGAPLADALPLRVAGGLHALHLENIEPALAPIYRGEECDADALVARAMQIHEDFLLPWLDSPPQTNEASRSSSFIAAMLWLADRGLPPRFECLEIGSSAGINLMIDSYGYDLGGVKVGPPESAMNFAPRWQGAPPPDRTISIVSTRGCDVAPIDLRDPAQAQRLKAYVWPEHKERFARIEAAVALARRRPPDLVPASAADFLEAELPRPQARGTTRVLMHSIVWQYLDPSEQEKIAERMARAGSEASEDRALAWIALEADRQIKRHRLTLRYWPGGEDERPLAFAHPHGADIEWLV